MTFHLHVKNEAVTWSSIWLKQLENFKPKAFKSNLSLANYGIGKKRNFCTYLGYKLLPYTAANGRRKGIRAEVTINLQKWERYEVKEELEANVNVVEYYS